MFPWLFHFSAEGSTHAMAEGDHVMGMQEKLAPVKAKIRSKVSGVPATADALETIPLPQDEADATSLHPRYAKVTPHLHTSSGTVMTLQVWPQQGI